ncbi:MAG: PD-(D/E)XK nuclease family protein [Elusimicrobia bacterium]|nr:PD-(D/E)XK nuclease family protein [Elusimicrobiota bacterium]
MDVAIKAARASFAWEFPGALAGPVLAGTRRILKKFLGSKVARELAHARILGREMPFTYGLDGQIVHGSMDMVLKMGNRIRVVDFKTDRGVAGAGRYREQGRMYVEAVRRALGTRDVDFSIVFLRTAKIVEVPV